MVDSIAIVDPFRELEKKLRDFVQTQYDELEDKIEQSGVEVNNKLHALSI